MKIEKRGKGFLAVHKITGKRLKGQPRSGFKTRGEVLSFGSKKGLLKRKSKRNKTKKRNSELLLLNPKTNKPKKVTIQAKVPGHMTRAEYNRTGKNRGPYFHDFDSKPEIFGLSDGGLYIKPKKGKKLWT